jgi:hypothetical protein
VALGTSWKCTSPSLPEGIDGTKSVVKETESFYLQEFPFLFFLVISQLAHSQFLPATAQNKSPRNNEKSSAASQDELNAN